MNKRLILCYFVASSRMDDQHGRKHARYSLVAGPGGSILTEANATPGVVTAPLPRHVLEREYDRNLVRETRERRSDW